MNRRVLTPCIYLSIALAAFPSVAANYVPGVPLAVVPVHDGVSDAIADELRTSIADALSQQPGIHVVAQNRVAEVMAYQDPSTVKSPVDAALSHALELQTRAKDHYLNFATTEAQAEIQSAVTEIRNSPLPLSDKGTILRDALVSAALIYGTDSFFEEALHIDPNLSLDNKGFSPKVRSQFARAKSRVMSGTPGTLVVTSDPKVADVIVNGVNQGVAPLTLQLPAGAYEVRVSGNRYTPVNHSVRIASGKTESISAKLSWQKSAPKASPSSISSDDVMALIQKGQDLITLLRLQKVVLLDVDTDASGAGEIHARMIDGTTKASHRPVSVRFDADRRALPQDVSKMVTILSAQATMKRIDNPVAQLDPAGVGDPIVLGRRKSHGVTPLTWGIIGGVAGASALAGILAVVLGGSSSNGSPSSGLGSVHVQLSK